MQKSYSCVIPGSLTFWTDDYIAESEYIRPQPSTSRRSTQAITRSQGIGIGHSVRHGGNTSGRQICDYTDWSASNTFRRSGVFTYIDFICTQYSGYSGEAAQRM